MIKKSTARKMIFSFVFLAIASVFGLNSFASNAFAAGVLTNKSVSLADAQPAVNTSYTINFRTATNATLTEIDYQFATTPSGTLTAPTGFGITGSLTASSGIGTGWTLGAVAGGLAKITTATPQVVNASTATSVTFSGVANVAIGTCTPASAPSSDTCYIRISTVANGGTVTDQGSVSYTEVAPVTTSVTVDPSFTMTVGGVASLTPITEGGTATVTTNATSTYNTISFGNIAAGQQSIVAQTLSVTTNALNGFTVKNAMTTQMGGTANSSNKIAPFYANSATWASPVAWTAPTGTTIPQASSDTTPNTAYASFIGGNTNDTLAGTFYNGSNFLYGPVNSTYNTVEASTSPVQAKVAYVTYSLETDVYMPADTYQGTLEYNAVANY